MGERKIREERKQATNFKKATCCPPAVVQETAQRKNGLCERSAWDNWEPREGEQPFLPNPSGIGDHITTLRRPLIGAV